MAQLRRKTEAGLSAGMRAVQRNARKWAGEANFRVSTNIPDAEKLSTALMTMLESEVPEGEELDVYRGALLHIAVAWNISLLSGAKRQEALMHAVSSLSGLDAAAALEKRELIERLMCKKEKLFPNDLRAIVSWDARIHGGCLQISAASLGAA
jgi:hypothetical protein